MNLILPFLTTTFLTNWKTSLAGLVTIGIAALNQIWGISIPGFPADFASLSTALPVGLGLILAGDAHVSAPISPTSIQPGVQ